VAVEFALLFPIFMVLALGMIAGGTAYSREINLTQSVREGSRFGATVGGATTNANTWLDTVDSGLVQASGNPNDPLGGYTYRCVAYVETDAFGVATSVSFRREDGATSTPATTGSCPGAAISDLKSAKFVQVVLKRPTEFFVLVANPTLQLDALSTTPYEGVTP